jgi:ketosteroid isomerase-like protein
MATNTDIVRTGYESFRRGDIQTTLAMFAEDIEWHEPEWTYGPASGTFRGRREVLRRIFAPIPELNDAFALEPHEFYGDGDTVIVTGEFHLSPRGTGARVRVPFAHVWTVHGGHIDSLRAYNDVRELVALHAVLDAVA